MTLFNPQDKQILVTYHYVRDPDPKFSAIHSCPVAEFDRQIAFLKEQFAVVSIPEVFEAAREKSDKRVCAVTFDDGLKDNFENAVPILEKHAVKHATFFPITETFENVLPATHKIHIILSYVPTEKLVEEFNVFLRETNPDKVATYTIPKDRRITEARKVWDDVFTANFKETMNIIPLEMRDAFLQRVFLTLGLDEKEFARDLFMSTVEIEELGRKGFAIGSHGHTHTPFDRLGEKEVRHEVIKSKEGLGRILGREVTLLSYPQGGAPEYASVVLKEEGFTHALTTEKRGVSETDSQFRIPRYDTNNIRDFLEKV
ncbi:MAG: polysaccharide deacetylase family protein [Parcubacteria group bacterium]|nr:polysaccharide deacetylase family protein [Parcubacteria group bacterium]